MANPNTKNTTDDQSGIHPLFAQRPSKPIEAGDEVVYTSLMHGTEPVQKTAKEARSEAPTQNMSVNDGAHLEFSDFPQEQSPAEAREAEKYAHVEGIPVVFVMPDKPNTAIEGVLVEYDDDQHFRVVGYDGDILRTREITAEELYERNRSREEERVQFEREMEAKTKGEVAPGKEPTRLENAVVLLRQYKKDKIRGGTQVRSMLKTALEARPEPEGGRPAAA